MKQSLKVLKMIQEDIPKDITEFESKLCNGENISTLFGRQAAILEALARILIKVIESQETNK